ncbi:hypothetical protein HG537_0A01430 [Torulaspora globosa]|uniref:Uncharacterized protein n=1 Tax=Torulaspora globosa TaxID=48254 RepID=A0A7H9HKK9_9SACH|nr:hypothetical protein HG537_0A01430 [Torulaspora sp. CBS 2947]
MSSSESDSGDTNSAKQDEIVADLKRQDKPNNKIFEKVTEVRPASVKKTRHLKEGKVSKNTSKVLKSQPRNIQRQRESRLLTAPINKRNATDGNSFYRGALLGSFLGATLTTVVTNLVAKAFQAS